MFIIEDETVAQRTVTVVEDNDDSPDDSPDDSSDDYENDCLDRRSHGRITKLLGTYGFIEATPCCRAEWTTKVIFFHRTGLFVSTFDDLVLFGRMISPYFSNS